MLSIVSPALFQFSCDILTSGVGQLQGDPELEFPRFRIMKPILLALSVLLAIPSALYPESYDSSVQVQENLSTTTTWDGASIHYPPGTAKVAVAIVTLAPGAETGWHTHPVPCLALILEGELLVELKVPNQKAQSRRHPR